MKFIDFVFSATYGHQICKIL